MIVDLQTILQRAVQADQTQVDYHMGAGQNRAAAPVPWAPYITPDKVRHARGCDCSAFACWSAGVDKHDLEFNCWWNTDAIVRDAMGANKRWRLIPNPVPGCCVVYAGHRKPDGTRAAGHIGIVVDVARQLTRDCGSSAFDDGGDGITLRHVASLWSRPPSLPQPIFCVPVDVEVPA
jgi:hypothetical protein